MVYEQAVGHNVFSVLGGVDAAPEFREGRLRASGPFAHSILAGTVGAVVLPLLVGIYRRHRLAAGVGILACIAIVLASASSGPIITTLMGVCGVAMWRFRRWTRALRWTGIATYIGLDLIMKAPPYYLLDRIDLVGGSGGWHRARLIESSIEHLREWWLYGTDYTRDWMPTGVAWNDKQTDITNHYLHMGVIGGLPLMFLFVAMLARAFWRVGVASRDNGPVQDRYLMWMVGAALFAQAITYISVSIFDQSIFLLYLTLAAVSTSPVRAANVLVDQPILQSVSRSRPLTLPRIASGRLQTQTNVWQRDLADREVAAGDRNAARRYVRMGYSGDLRLFITTRG
jgi:hypothetical protein